MNLIRWLLRWQRLRRWYSLAFTAPLFRRSRARALFRLPTSTGYYGWIVRSALALSNPKLFRLVVCSLRLFGRSKDSCERFCRGLHVVVASGSECNWLQAPDWACYWRAVAVGRTPMPSPSKRRAPPTLVLNSFLIIFEREVRVLLDRVCRQF